MARNEDKTVDILWCGEYESLDLTYIKAEKKLEADARYSGLSIKGDIDILKLIHDLEIPLADIMPAYNSDGSIKRYEWE